MNTVQNITNNKTAVKKYFQQWKNQIFAINISDIRIRHDLQ